MYMEEWNWLRRLCSADAPGEAADIIAGYFQGFAPVERDAFGSVIARLPASGPAGPKILFDAHLDTIGMLVTAIDKDGFLRCASSGRLDARVLSGAEVTVWGKSPMPGVICCLPPHLSRGNDRSATPVEEIAIDIGFASDVAQSMVSPGDRITFRQDLKPMHRNLVCGKSLDNRAGAAALITAAECLKHAKDLPCSVTFLFSEQEENGGSPAEAAVFRVLPDQAIVVDVSFAASYRTPPEVEAQLGKGPMLGVSANLSRTVFQALEQAAGRAGIAAQIEVMSNRTGTNADRMVGASGGVPCGLVSIPLRNMHTAAEIVDLNDVRQTGLLLAEYAKEGGCHA